MNVKTVEQLKAAIKENMEQQFERVCRKLEDRPELADEVIADVNDPKRVKGNAFMDVMSAIGLDMAWNYGPPKGDRKSANRVNRFNAML